MVEEIIVWIRVSGGIQIEILIWKGRERTTIEDCEKPSIWNNDLLEGKWTISKGKT